MKEIQKTMKDKADTRRVVELRRLAMERERFWWEKADQMFGRGSSAPAAEREVAQRLMRKRVLRNLQEEVGEADVNGSERSEEAPDVAVTDRGTAALCTFSVRRCSAVRAL